MSRSVYVTRPLPAPGTSLLEQAGLTVVQHPREQAPERHELVAGVRDVDALLCMLSERVDVELLERAPRLRVVANLAVGFDNIDLDAARARGVVVTNTPDVLTDATADLTWALLLAAARRLREGDRLVRSGRWQGWGPTQLLGLPVAGATIGIVGLGKIGTAVALRARGFGMEVCYVSRHRAEEGERRTGARRVDLDSLLSVSDFISLHAPLHESSRHLIDEAALARVKPSAVLVNTARGPLVDEAALITALRDGQLAAAGLDVFEREPAIGEGLAALDNVVLAPHLGSATTAARSAMVGLCSRNIVAVLAGEPPLTPVGDDGPR